MTINLFIAMYVLVLIAVALHEQIALGKQSSLTWEKLVANLQPTWTEGIIQAGSVINKTTGNEHQPTFGQAFIAIGGSEGLRRIQTNTRVIMALAAYIDLWSLHANSETIALMRKDALKIRWTAVLLVVICKVSRRDTLATSYLYEIASLYCHMVERLLKLCEVVHSARYPALLAAVNW